MEFQSQAQTLVRDILAYVLDGRIDEEATDHLSRAGSPTRSRRPSRRRLRSCRKRQDLPARPTLPRYAPVSRNCSIPCVSCGVGYRTLCRSLTRPMRRPINRTNWPRWRRPSHGIEQIAPPLSHLTRHRLMIKAMSIRQSIRLLTHRR